MKHARSVEIGRKAREERVRALIPYLIKTGNIPAARKLAKADNVSENTSVWVSALGVLLGDQPFLGDQP